MVYARYLHSRISAGAKKVGAGHISPRAFRTHIVRFWHLLGCRAIEIGTPFPGGGVIFTVEYDTMESTYLVQVVDIITDTSIRTDYFRWSSCLPFFWTV